MIARCFIAGCDEPATRDSDECAWHLRQYEDAEREHGYTPSPCERGHYGCAHYERGRCHGYQPDPDSTLCPDGWSNCQY